MKTSKLSPFRYLVIMGNALFILWILVNGINEGFRGTIVEIASYIGLLTLLVVNCFAIAGK